MLTQPRFTPQRMDSGYMNTEVVAMASGATLFVGALVCLQNVGTGSSARAVRGQVATGLRAIGIMDNQPHLIPKGSYTSTQDGFPKVQIRKGCFKLDISSSDPVTEQDLYKAVYVLDDHTIAKTSGGNARSLAGVLQKIDNSTDPTGAGAWVDVGALPSSGFPLPTGLGLP